jgi:tuft1 protein
MTALIRNLKRFFEVKAGIERIEEQIKELKEDKKSYLETLENLERELKRELNIDDLSGVQISHGLNMSIEVVKKEDKEAGNE